MKDETLREALRTAAKHEPSVGDPFTRFEAARRRNTVARGLVVAAIGAFLILSFAFVFPNPLKSGAPAEYPSGGEIDPLPNDVRIYEDPVAGFQLRYPAQWRARGEHGRSVAFFVDAEAIGKRDAYTDLFVTPEGYTLEVPRTFYIEVTPDLPGNDTKFIDREHLELIHDFGAIVTEGDLLPAARGQERADQLRVIYGDRPEVKKARRLDYWCQRCNLVELVVTLQPDRGVPPLYVRMVAPSQTTYAEFGSELLPLIDSIERLIILGG